KRVIAVSGDKVYINFSTGKVYVNELELVEYYVNSPTERQYDIAFPITVPEGSVFLLGDNRNDSLDSRSSLIGCVDERSVIGKVLFKLSITGWKVK
ncbi:MAG: signal peptidase I, partial [Clostridiales bacterium]|nr:signal peptidase I [Clostridiales bacterium]